MANEASGFFCIMVCSSFSLIAMTATCPETWMRPSVDLMSSPGRICFGSSGNC